MKMDNFLKQLNEGVRWTYVSANKRIKIEETEVNRYTLYVEDEPFLENRSPKEIMILLIRVLADKKIN